MGSRVQDHLEEFGASTNLLASVPVAACGSARSGNVTGSRQARPST